MKNFLLFSFITLFTPFSVLAVCPVCSVAVAGGVGLCKFLGIDDLISGSWIGGLLMSLTFWTIDWLEKRKIKFLFRKILVLLFWYGIAILSLKFSNFIGNPYNQFLGIDKLLFGIISGSFAFSFAVIFHKFLIKKNWGRPFFPFQKVAIPLFFLILLSFLFYFVTKC